MSKRIYRHLLNIPEKTIGKFSITKKVFPANHKFELASVRARLLGGQKKKEVSYPDPTTIHVLTYPGGQMAEYPCEIEQHYNCLKSIKGGRVLVGGLGIGLTLALLPKKCDMVVVEVSKEVIELVRPSTKRSFQTGGTTSIVQADLVKWLQTTNEKFDHAFFDIWASDGEDTFFHTVCPLLEAAEGKIKNRPICWNEDVMRGQLAMSLYNGFRFKDFPVPPGSKPMPTLKEMATPKGTIWWDWKVPFYQKVCAGLWTEKDINTYVSVYGLPEFKPLWYLPPTVKKKEPVEADINFLTV